MFCVNRVPCRPHWTHYVAKVTLNSLFSFLYFLTYEIIYIYISLLLGFYIVTCPPWVFFLHACQCSANWVTSLTHILFYKCYWYMLMVRSDRFQKDIVIHVCHMFHVHPLIFSNILLPPPCITYCSSFSQTVTF